MKSKKLKQLIAIAIVGITLSTMYPIPVAAEWLQNSQNNWSWIENGEKANGWKQIDGIWYYFDDNGNMKTGWVQTPDSKWYFINSDGSMNTGWLQTPNGNWYNLGSDGAMKTGWIQEANGKWYFADASGVMQIGVIEVEGKTYVLAESGAMLSGTITVGGKTYTTDESGAIIGWNPPSENRTFTKEGVIITPNTTPNSGTPVAGGNNTGNIINNTESSSLSSGSSSDSSSSSSSSSSNSSSGNGSLISLSAITVTAIFEVTAPVTGETPVSTIDATQYTATISWSGTPTSFAGNTIYTATIIITPKTGYTLTGVAENFFTVAGATTVTNSINSGVVTAVFPKAEAIIKETPTEDVGVSATAVNPGQTLATSFLSGTFKNASNEAVTGVLTWEDATQTVDETGDFDWRFTPTETERYKKVTGTVEVTTSAAVVITTPAAVSVITVSGAGDATTVVEGETLQMNAYISPDNAINKIITWSVSNGTGTATIDEYGLLTATGTGTVTVNATNVASGVTGTKDITVKVSETALVAKYTNAISVDSVKALLSSNTLGLMLWNYDLIGDEGKTKIATALFNAKAGLTTKELIQSAVKSAMTKSIISVNSSPADGAYKAGNTIAINVTFDGVVTVTGTPALCLETGTNDRMASYVGGSGTNVLTFNYEVQGGDSSSDLEYTAANALILNSGTIIGNGTDINANLTLPSPGDTGSLGYANNIIIDTKAPTDIKISTQNTISGNGNVRLTAIGDSLSTDSWNNILNLIKTNTAGGNNWIGGIVPDKLTITPSVDGASATLNNTDTTAANIVRDFIIPAATVVDKAGNSAANDIRINSCNSGITDLAITSKSIVYKVTNGNTPELYVPYAKTAGQLKKDLKAVDDSPQTYVVTDSANITKSDDSILLLGDKLIVTSESGLNTKIFPITVAPEPVTTIQLTDNALNASSISIDNTKGKEYYTIARIVNMTVADVKSGLKSTNEKAPQIYEITDNNGIVMTDGMVASTGSHLIVTAYDGENKSTYDVIIDMNIVSVDDISVVEGNSGTVDAVFTLKRLGSIDSPFTIKYDMGGYVAAGQSEQYMADADDYDAFSCGNITFDAGVRIKTFTVKVYGDTKKELDETFKLRLLDESIPGVTIPFNAICTIKNDD